MEKVNVVWMKRNLRTTDHQHRLINSLGLKICVLSPGIDYPLLLVSADSSAREARTLLWELRKTPLSVEE